MKKANISTIKMELSKYLRFVRQGEEVLILDRDQAIAKIVPVANVEKLRIIEPQADLKSVLASLPPRPFTEDEDIVAILSDDREDRF